MTLAALIRKRESGRPANANPAKAANDGRATVAPLAKLAALALATSPAADAAIRSHWWRLHYGDRDPLEVACTPDATHAEILKWFPDATAAEPFEPIRREPAAPLAADDEAAILEWLARIDETDPATIADILTRCRTDADAREFFIGEAGVGSTRADSCVGRNLKLNQERDE